MIVESADYLPIWMLLSTAVGFMIGNAFGDSRRHRKCLEQANEDLRDRLKKARAGQEPLLQELKQQRGLLNDIHGYLLPVSKGSAKPTA
jgi:hypothetical protein